MRAWLYCVADWRTWGGLCFLMKVRSSRKEGVEQLGPQRTQRIQSPRAQGPAPLCSFHWIFSLKTRISGQTLGNLRSQACICIREVSVGQHSAIPSVNPCVATPGLSPIYSKSKGKNWPGKVQSSSFRECLTIACFSHFQPLPFVLQINITKELQIIM